MKNFNGFSMLGITAADNKAIIEAISNEIDLTIDELDRVWNEAGIYIADAKKVEDGFGILCK